MVVSPAAAKDRFVGPVCVLTDEDCFSATDVFLGALAELPQVTLVGRASGGGSGRAREFALAYSGIRVRLSSMASFRPDGRRYDGRGIEVDIHVQPGVGDFSGTTDSDLDAALRVIEAR
jgi:C-terminal processing protease CtpA/Prc